MISNINRQSFKYGIYAGIILALWYLFLIASNWYISAAGNYLYLIAIICLGFFTLLLYRKFKDLNKQPFLLKFKSALALCLTATLLFFISTLIIHFVFYPEYVEQAVAAKRDMLYEQASGNVKFSITDKDMEVTENYLRKKLSFTGLLIFNFGLIAFQGLIISLVVSFATKPWSN